MAFKPVTLDDSAVCVTPFDPAVDDDASDWAAYADAWMKAPGAWRDHIKAKDGEQITEFVVGVVPPAEMARITDECRSADKFREEEARWRCFCWGLRDIKGWPVEVKKIKRGSVEYVDPKWIAETFVRGLRKVALTVGMSVWMFNQLTEEEIKN